MEKFSRTYKINFYFGWYSESVVTMESSDTMISVEFPITLDMSISRSISSVMNTATLVLYGLDETKRKRLAKDRNNFGKYIRMDIYGGYQGNQWLIYRGAIQECYSARNGGETEFKTYIESSDTAMELCLGSTTSSFEEGADVITQINNVGSSLLDLHLGAVSKNITFTQTLRGRNLTGNPLNILRKIGLIHTESGDESTLTTDLGNVYFLRQNTDVLKSLGVLYIDDTYGLLGTPRRRDMLVSVKMIFEPAANLNQLCIFQSKALGIWGTYKIMGVSHNGTISGGKCGKLITTIDLFLGNTEFYEV